MHHTASSSRIRSRDRLARMGTDAKGQAGRGRPADPDIERRVIAAALSVYGEVGWAGFTLDRVARRAHACVVMWNLNTKEQALRSFRLGGGG